MSFKPEPAFVAFISTYELTAILTGRVPTITSLVSRLPPVARRTVECAVGVYLAWHFEAHSRNFSRNRRSVPIH